MIDENEIKDILLYNYGISLIDLKKITDGSADLFVVNNIYVIKIFQLNYDLDRVKREIDITNYLSKNLVVPSFIKTINYNYYCFYNNRIVVLMNYIEGYSVPAFKATNEQIIDSAQKYGQLILMLSKYNNNIPTYDVQNYTLKNIDITINNINKLINKCNNDELIKDLKYRIEVINSINECIEDDISIINCHGDYYVSQCIYENNVIKSIIDYGSVKKMPVSIELIRSYIYLDKNGENGEFRINGLVNYVKEFMKYYKLNKSDLKYMPYMYLIKLLRSDFGYKQYIENSYRKDDFLEIGKKLQKQIIFIFNNLNTISKELERILE